HALHARGVRAVSALRSLDAGSGDRALPRSRRAQARAVPPRAIASRRSDGSARSDVSCEGREARPRGPDLVRGHDRARGSGGWVKIRFWGVRGSFAMCGREFLRYGGNTTSVELVSDDGHRLLVDLGTGATELAKQLVQSEFGKGRGKLPILLSHTHLDHIQG